MLGPSLHDATPPRLVSAGAEQFLRHLYQSVFIMRWFLVVAALFAVAGASMVRKCGTDEPLKENPNTSFSSCEKPPCKLKRKTEIAVQIKFTPPKDVTKVIDSVHAKIVGIPFPFIGVDGTSICDKIYDTAGTKVGCPLKAGQEYLYKDSFKVLEVYPKIKVWVHWALVDEDGKSFFCFEVPVKITS